MFNVWIERYKFHMLIRQQKKLLKEKHMKPKRREITSQHTKDMSLESNRAAYIRERYT